VGLNGVEHGIQDVPHVSVKIAHQFELCEVLYTDRLAGGFFDCCLKFVVLILPTLGVARSLDW
jgi:hypothetical protein